jgi:hypothetical protein
MARAMDVVSFMGVSGWWWQASSRGLVFLSAAGAGDFWQMPVLAQLPLEHCGNARG